MVLLPGNIVIVLAVKRSDYKNILFLWIVNLKAQDSRVIYLLCLLYVLYWMSSMVANIVIKPVEWTWQQIFVETTRSVFNSSSLGQFQIVLPANVTSVVSDFQFREIKCAAVCQTNSVCVCSLCCSHVSLMTYLDHVTKSHDTYLAV